MKLLVQSDDYGITKAVSLGIIGGIRNGIVRNTGLFANMPWAEECVELIRPYLDQIDFGIDLNSSTGPSLLGYEKVPGLCHENGMFLTSKENRALDTEENGHDHVNYDEILAEFDTQVQRFIELTGKKPDYIHGHAYGTKTTFRAYEAIAEKYGCPVTTKIIDQKIVSNFSMAHYRFGNEMQAQLQDDLKERILGADEAFMKGETGFIISHCGYIDAALFGLSSFTVYRPMDLAALTDPEVKEWVKRNQVELIRYRDLVNA